MHHTEDQINAAINAAELVASQLNPDNQPVTVTNRVLLTLIAGAKGSLERIEDLEERLEAAREALR